MPLFSTRQARFSGTFLAASIALTFGLGIFPASSHAQERPWPVPASSIPSASSSSVSASVGFASEPYQSGTRPENRSPAVLEVPHGSFPQRQADSPTSRPLVGFASGSGVRQVMHEQPGEHPQATPRRDVVTAEGSRSENAIVPAVPASSGNPPPPTSMLPEPPARAAEHDDIRDTVIHETLAEEPAPLHAAKPLPGLNGAFPHEENVPSEKTGRNADRDGENDTSTDSANFLDRQSRADSREQGSLMDMPLEHSKREKSGETPARPKGAFLRVLSTLGSLCLVLAVFFGFVLLLRGTSGKAGQSLPKEAAEHLGRIPLTAKVQLHLLRIGNRLVLLSVTADGATTLTELTDADEVVQVLAACRRNDDKGSSAAFRQVLNGFLPGGSGVGERSGEKRSPAGLGDLYTPADDSLTSLLASGLPVKGK